MAIKPVEATVTESTGFSDKGLARGQIGVLGAVVIGIACIAPAYALTSGLGPTIAAVGTHVPAVLLMGFLPMLLVAFGYRELNTRMPDSGTTFTWATKAFNPWIGWMGGWGLIAATVIVLSNLAAVAVDFFYIFLAQVCGNEHIADLKDNLVVNIATTFAFIAIATFISYRGLGSTKIMQYGLVAFQLLVLGAFAIAALIQAHNGTSFHPTPIHLDWFNPASIGNFSTVAAGVSLSIFLFWGWDTTLTMNEETKDPEHTAGRASTITVVVIIAIYLLCALGVVAWAGIGDTGLGAGNPENQESLFAALAPAVMGPFALLMSLTVLISSFSSLNSTLISPSRTLLAMSYYKALPPAFAKLSPRFYSPSVATLASAIAAGLFYAIVRVISENALRDTITALGLMICFYYGITSIACVWYFRKELFVSVHSVFFKFLFPLIGGIALLTMFVKTSVDSMDPNYGSGSSLGGVGMVFILGMGVLGIGVILMVMTRMRYPAFFRGETLPRAESTTDNSEVLV